MDKIAVNNFVVELRTDVKAAKAMVAGNLVRKINDIKKALEKQSDGAKKEKSEKKIEALHADVRMLKEIDPYLVCKNAILKPDAKHWNDLIGDSKASEEARLMARIISKGRIQKQVTKFRSDHKDCDEWIEEYFEYREKKRELTEVKVAKRKTKQMHNKTKKTSTSKKAELSRKWNKNSRKLQRERPVRDGTGINDQKDVVGDRPKKFPKQQKFDAKDESKVKEESLHPSWASKRKEKEILKAALSGKGQQQAKRIILSSS